MTSSVSQSLSLTMSSPPPLVHAVSGAMGGAIALVLLYPLERIRIEMQKQLKMQQNHHDDKKIMEHDDETIVFSSSPIKPHSSPPSSKDISIGDSWSFETIQHTGNTDTTNEHFQDAMSEVMSQNIEPQNKPPQQHHQAIVECFRSLLQRNELYRGIAPVVTTLAVSNFIFFYINEWFKNHLLRQPQSSSSSAAAKIASRTTNLRYRSLLASCLAGIFNVLITNPLWVTNLRIATGDAKYNDLISEMIHTIRQHNNTIQHLWSGTMASLLLVSNPVIQFFVYEELKTWQPRNNNSQQKPHQITPIKAFVIGAIAKTIATMLTYPIQVAQSLLRMQEKMNDTVQSDSTTECNQHCTYTGTTDCLKQLYHQNGIISLYTGIRAKLLQTVLTAAFTFVSYEQIVQILHTFLLLYQSNHSTSRNTSV